MGLTLILGILMSVFKRPLGVSRSPMQFPAAPTGSSGEVHWSTAMVVRSMDMEDVPLRMWLGIEGREKVGLSVTWKSRGLWVHQLFVNWFRISLNASLVREKTNKQIKRKCVGRLRVRGSQRFERGVRVHLECVLWEQ